MTRILALHMINALNAMIEITLGDEVGPGGAPTSYAVHFPEPQVVHGPGYATTIGETMAPLVLPFQNGDPAKVGCNGLTIEVLLAIAADRLGAFQQGPFACDENEAALTGILHALDVLRNRAERLKVEAEKVKSPLDDAIDGEIGRAMDASLPADDVPPSAYTADGPQPETPPTALHIDGTPSPLGVEMVWIPEAPEHPGLYAVDPRRAAGQNCTYTALNALMFATREECAAWCATNPVPAFEPREHGFG